MYVRGVDLVVPARRHNAYLTRWNGCPVSIRRPKANGTNREGRLARTPLSFRNSTEQLVDLTRSMKQTCVGTAENRDDIGEEYGPTSNDRGGERLVHM